MSLDLWAAFAAASALLLIIPGPTVLLVLSYALGRGRRAAVPMALGVAAGDFTAMTLSMLGVGALLSSSAALFTLVKWVGAAYLVWLGLRLWRSGGEAPGAIEMEHGRVSRMVVHAWTVTTFNPKSILFFVAFVPQFLEPGRAFLPQAAVMVATFVGLAVVNVLAIATLGARAGAMIRSERGMRLVRRGGGASLMGAGAATALMGRV